MSMERRIRKANEEFMAKIDLDPAFYPAYEQGLPGEIYESYKADLPGDKQYWLNIIEEILHDAKNDYTRAVQESIEVIPGISELYKVETYIRYHYNKRGINKLGATQLHPVFKVQNTYDGSVNIFHTVNALAEYIEAERDKMQEVRKTAADEKGLTRVSSHLIEQGLLPARKRERPDLFSDGKMKRYERAGIEPFNPKGVGITYTVGEISLVDALQDIYWKSIEDHEGRVKGKKVLRNGLEEKEIATYIEHADGPKKGETVNTRLTAPSIGCSIGELTRRAKGKDRVSGRDIQEVLAVLGELQHNPDKIPLIAYEYEVRRENKRYRRTLLYHEPLVKLVTQIEQVIDDETGLVDRRQDVRVVLNPVFRHQIEGKYIMRRTEINKLLMDANKRAHGTRKTTLTLRLLYEELLHARSQSAGQKDGDGNRVYKIRHGNLVDKIGYNLTHRRGREEQYLGKAVETLKELGLILEYQQETTAAGRPRMHTFTLNKAH